jgi:tetratricopeptide (TPR) repeat protein
MLRLDMKFISLVAIGLLVFAPLSHAQSAKELKAFESFLAIMDGYLGIIESTHAINADAEKAAILQLQKVKEVREDQGDPQAAIDLYEGVLRDAKNPAVRNAVYMMLGDLLKDEGRYDDAAALFKRAVDENLAALDGP